MLHGTHQHPLPETLSGKKAKNKMQICATFCYTTVHYSVSLSRYSYQTVKCLSCPSGDGGYPYAPQQLALGAEGAKTTSKYGEKFCASYEM